MGMMLSRVGIESRLASVSLGQFQLGAVATRAVGEPHLTWPSWGNVRMAVLPARRDKGTLP